MPSPSDAPRDLPDRVIRQALCHPANLHAFLKQTVPALAEGFDCERRRVLEREFPLDDWRRREADLPFEIPYRLGDQELWALVYVLIEHQSAEDPVMPLRVLYFVVLYWERQWRAWEKKTLPKQPLRLSPVLPLVLYTGGGAWQNNRTLHDLLGEPGEFHGFVPQWSPLFWELSDHDADELLASGDAWQETLAVIRAQGTDAATFERIYVEALRRLAPVAAHDRVRWYDLVRAIVSWALWRRPGPERQNLLAAAQATQTDTDRQKEIRLMGQTIAEAIWEEGRLKGEADGELKGELKALRRTLRQLLTARFGTLPEAVAARIENCSDVDRLTAAIVRVSDIASPDEIGP
ncbi:MAG TPA: Rpn family recombination-promoting nuclease/putative transposase [Gemmataceae bacterium]|nr:Rpn family recombination-promoting nuclease/putative transposase [Gemmataceae bacterium]